MADTPFPILPCELRERGVTLRRRRVEDNDFLVDLYISTRWDELTPTGWPDNVKTAFLRQQFDLQSRHYDAHYPGAAWIVVENEGVQIGRLYLQLSGNDLRVIDISLLPSSRGKGLGSALMRAVQTLSQELAVATVSLHVDKQSPALSLYQRLGFTVIEDCGVAFRMEWASDDQVKSAS